MAYDFRAWFACPACEDREGVSALAHQTEIVFECHGCGLTSEYVIGEDIPLRGLDVDAIAEAVDDGTSD